MSTEKYTNDSNTQAALAVKCKEVVKMKIKKYCQFERITDLENLLQTSEAVTLLDDFDSDGQSPIEILTINL